MSISSLFNFDSIENAEIHSQKTLLDILELEATIVEQPVEKKRIRFGSPEYYKWVGKVKSGCVKVASFIKSMLPSEVQTECPCCKGSGEYVGATYRTRCARCKGKGYMTQADTNAYRTWTHARDTGLPKVREDLGASFNLAA